MSTIITFPTAPIQGGQFNLVGTRSNFAACQLSPNKFMVALQQENPEYILGQVIEIQNQNTVNFNNTWVLNAVQGADVIILRKINENKALICLSRRTGTTLTYFQVLTVDSNNDISVGPLTSFPGSNIAQSDELTQLTMVNRNIGLLFFSEGSSKKVSRFYVNTNTNQVIVSAPVLRSDYSSEIDDLTYIPEYINSNEFYFAFTTGTVLRVAKMTINNLYDININISTNATFYTNTISPPGSSNIRSINGVDLENGFSYYSVYKSDATVQSIAEFRRDTQTWQLYQFPIQSQIFKTLCKIDSFHFAGVDSLTPNTSSGTTRFNPMRISVYRSLAPGILMSPSSPILGDSSVTIRENSRMVSSNKNINMNRNTFVIDSNYLVHFYKTTTGYKIAILY